MIRILLLLLLAWHGPASAHKASTSYLQLSVHGEAVTGRWDVALRDLDYALGLDTDGDTLLTWGEVRHQQSRIAGYALRRLTLRADQDDCRLLVEGLQIADHSDGRYASLTIKGKCPHEPVSLGLHYELLFDVDAQHRGLLNLDFRGSHSALLAPEERTVRFNAAGASGFSVFTQYFRAGVSHLWTGWDHMLFLAGLFLPAVVRRRAGTWQPASSLKVALIDTSIMVTAFTLAHALTLSLAATGLFSPPVRWVESGVAASVLFAGLNNLIPMVYRHLFWLAAAFGLVHGAAIAGALIELGLPAGDRVWALLAFNLGVEAAQLAVLLVVIPPSFICRRSRYYRWLVVIPGALIITVVGALWLVQRAFDVDFAFARF
ncbi:MAG TPA: HupE/UreJ family protein [Burkholderiales bacterium]|nr:HupE/UreJ family protein [Burkholderiales bacterium]